MDIRGELTRISGRLQPRIVGRLVQTALAAGASWELALQWAARVDSAVIGLRAADDSLGTNVMAVGAQELADHALRASEARASAEAA